MATFTMKHELDCDCDRFWALFFDREFNEALFKALGFPAWTLASTYETAAEIVRHVTAIPKIEAPAAVAKLLGSSFGYDEQARFDKASKTLTFVITPNVLAGKLKNEGTLRCDPRADGRSTRVVTIVAEAKVFGLGSIIESVFEKSFQVGWQDSANFLNTWVSTRPKAAG